MGTNSEICETIKKKTYHIFMSSQTDIWGVVLQGVVFFRSQEDGDRKGMLGVDRFVVEP